MKRAILKAVSVVMVVAMMLCTTIGVYADTITVSQNPADTTLNISGTLEGAKPYEDSAVVIIFHKDVTPTRQAEILADLSSAVIGTEVLGIQQATVDTNGDFACDITLEDDAANGTGSYSVVAVPSTTATPVATAAYFVPSADKLAILKTIIAAPTQSDIETNKSVFGFDANTNWDLMSAHQTAIAANLAPTGDNAILAELRANIGSVTLDDVDDVTLAIAQEVYALALANNVADPNATSTPAPMLADIADMDQYADVEAYENAYANYTTAAGRSAVDAAVVGTGLPSFAALFNEYKEQILLNSVVTPADDNGVNSRLALDALAASAGLDFDSVTKYNASNATNRQTVADACKVSGATTFAALNTAFVNAVTALPAPTATPSPSLGGGGGGGGGSITTVVQPTPTPSQKPIYERYNDINDYEWAWDAIEVLSDKGIIAGYENGSFAPANSILREEFIKLAVVGLLGTDAIDASAVSSFTDAQSGWYAPYIAAAETSNITSGIGNGLFGTGAQITRQDMALMLYRMLRDASVNGPADAYAFTDADEIADYAAEAVYTLKNMGIINGDPDGSFRPNGQTTRAEAAVLLYKTLDRLGKIVY